MSSSHGTKAIVAAFFANLSIAGLKFGGFLITGSGSMLAEAVHSVADSGNQGLLLLGSKKASKPRDASRPFGYGRERFFWSFVVALVLFSMGAVFAIYEGIHKLRHPQPIDSAGVAIGLLLAAVALEAYSFRTAIVEAQPLRRGNTWWQFIRRSRNPELPVVLLEDLAALAGLMIALFSIVMTEITGDGEWDATGTLAIGVLLGVVAAILAVEMHSLLLGEPATPEVEDRITSAIIGVPEVQRLIHLRTEHLGPEELLVAAKVEFDPGLTIGELADVIDVLESRVRAEVPEASTIYIEPDVHRPQLATT
jgi:cation diffusion facilitator family transporter